METKKVKVRRRKIRKPASLRKRISDYLKNRRVESGWELNTLIAILVIIAVGTVLYLFLGDSFSDTAPRPQNNIVNVKIE